MPGDEEGPSTALGLLRVGTLISFIALALFFLWEFFSQSAALSRLSATAEILPYTERCDADGNLITTGRPNCVDLGRYVFVHGTVNKAFRKACAGQKGAAEMLSFEEGKASRTEINGIQKSLRFQAQTGVVTERCEPLDVAP